VSASLPPGPPLPAAVQALAWARRPLPFLERCHRRYGDVFTLRIRNAGTWVLLCDPDDVRRVFTLDHRSLGVGIANSILGPLLGPRSVMLLEEPEHVRRRRLLLAPFHGDRVQRYGDTVTRLTREQIGDWGEDRPFELWPHMQQITLSSIMHLVFGGTDTPRLRSLRALLMQLTDWMNDPRRMTLLAALGSSWLAANRGYRDVMFAVEETVLSELRERERCAKCDERPDIASLLARARYEDGSPMSEQDLRDELVTLLTDGPTSALLCWAFERLLRHPDKLARLRDEVRGGDLEEDYLDAVVKETMRLCPAAPIVVRRLLEPARLGGYELPAGTTVAPCVYLLHRRADLYPNPGGFIPERFLGEPAGSYSWIPFGGGVRRCPAASYAQMLMKRVIATVVSEVELEAVRERPERPRKSAITFVPDAHGLVRVRRKVTVPAG
jgi:cytochrome P450 family 135